MTPVRGRRALARALAGPALIAAVVLIVLHDMVVHDLLSAQHPDVLAYWLPTYCHLGTTIAAGHVPAWNPSVMAGVPFAADPQSGWMYLPSMVLFSALPCDVAMRAMIVLQPVLAGVGLYAFLRSEGLSRPAATLGGMAISAGIAASRFVLFVPFSASFAWTALTLAACSRYLKARTWAARFAWAIPAAAAWGQLAAAHFAHGFLVGSAAIAAFLVASIGRSTRTSEMSRGDAARIAGLLLAAVVVVNLAFLWPRLAYLPRTSYHPGSSGDLNEGLLLPADWPLKLATFGGGFLGATALVLVFAGLRNRRFRHLATAFGVLGCLAYLASTGPAGRVAVAVARRIPGLAVAAHFPARFGLGLIVALAVLASLGLDAWCAAGSIRDRLLMLVPGLVVWLLLPPLFGAGLIAVGPPLVASVVAVILLVALMRRSELAWLLPVLLAVELVTSGLLGLTAPVARRIDAAEPFGAQAVGWFTPLLDPTIDARAYLRPSSIAQALRGRGRYLSLDPEAATNRGFLTLLSPRWWGLLANQRSMLFGLEDAQGYNPVQLSRYWTFVRRATDLPLDYNAAIFPDPSARVLDLLGVDWIVAPAGSPPPDTRISPVAVDGRWALFARVDAPPRASFVSRWRVVRGPDRALADAMAPGTDPSSEVVLEEDPGLGPSGPASSEPFPATYRSTGLGSAVITVVAPRDGMVVVRNSYDPGWRARIDGRPARVLAADGIVQAVPVPAGRHTITLAYRDPSIALGILGSCFGVVTLLAVGWLARRRASRRASAQPGLDDDLGEPEPVLE
jgi:hypothetical protein